ncbi:MULTISPECIES: Bro-N domain-containing protein [unclassified Xanthobacter]|uniref:BRO-N domain-containing protein n=1 Tax=unclassified Xanthobacter TaxID=2623496 RepID=UPI001F46EB2A|nr:MULTISPECIES: Bro-N domain-containing protein [unclassified Xanthobacter]
MPTASPSPASTFIAFSGHDIRTVLIDGAPWWVAVDVCAALGMPTRSGTGHYLTSLDADEQRVITLASTEGNRRGNLNKTAITESGLYFLAGLRNVASRATFLRQGRDAGRPPLH